MQDFVELIFLQFPYCGILSTFYVVGFCPVGFCLKVWDFVRRDFVLWDSVPDSLKPSTFTDGWEDFDGF